MPALRKAWEPSTIEARNTWGASDKAVISLRRLLLNEIKNLQDGQEPTHVVTDPAKNHFPHVDTIAEVIPAGEDWRQRFKHLTEMDL